MTKPEGPTSTLRILYDHSSEVYERHREFRDDPTVNSLDEEYLWYMVVQVRFGKVLLPDDATALQTTENPEGSRVSKAGMQ